MLLADSLLTQTRIMCLFINEEKRLLSSICRALHVHSPSALSWGWKVANMLHFYTAKASNSIIHNGNFISSWPCRATMQEMKDLQAVSVQWLRLHKLFPPHTKQHVDYWSPQLTNNSVLLLVTCHCFYKSRQHPLCKTIMPQALQCICVCVWGGEQRGITADMIKPL